MFWQKDIVWTQALMLVNSPLKLTLICACVSASISALMSELLAGNFIIGLIIGAIVATLVSYPVGKIILTNIEKIQRQNAELERLNKELETYNHILAHDIKNKVSIISLSSQMITRKISPDNKMYPHAHNINTSSLELAKMINNLLLRQIDYEETDASQLENKSA